MSVDDEMTWILDAMRDRQARNAELLARFEAMTADERQAATLLSYVCDTPEGCLLLSVWDNAGERCWYAPSHAPAEEQTEAPEAPEASASAGLLSDILDDGQPMNGVGLTLNCKHIRDRVLSSAELATELADADATAGHPKHVAVPAKHPG